MGDIFAAADGDRGDDTWRERYTAYLERISARFQVNAAGSPLFRTDAVGLFDAYLNALPAEDRATHDCHACRRFVERFGGLVTIDGSGAAASALWDVDDAGALYRASTEAMLAVVRRARVTQVFLSSDETLGQPLIGGWQHLSVRLAEGAQWRWRSTVQSAGQAMAEKRQDYEQITAALAEYPLESVETAVRLLESEALYRSEKVLGVAQWLRDLHVARSAAAPAHRANVVWRAVATAPAGFCHPRSSMIGTLLDDIAAGKDFAAVSRSFAAKMHPLQYQRPQAAPSAGTIAQAEKIVASLGAAGSLARRFARMSDIRAHWSPPPQKEPPAREGVFGHLKPKNAPTAVAMELPLAKITWEKFNRSVLPTAERIELHTKAKDNYCILVTAVNPEAPPILQWDSEENRNPVSSYLWVGGSASSQFGLPSGDWVEVTAVTLTPSSWGESCLPHHGDGVIFVLSGARETRSGGVMLFPEILRHEFHGVRSVIEAYSRGAKLEPIDEPHVVGPVLVKGQRWNARVRVASKGQTAVYELDRWD